MTSATDIAVERGSGNVFADLGLPDPDAHLLRAELVGRIDDTLRERGIGEPEAARLLGLSRADVSRLLRGDFREHSLERLLRGLTALGHDIDIVIRRPRSVGKTSTAVPAARVSAGTARCAGSGPSRIP